MSKWDYIDRRRAAQSRRGAVLIAAILACLIALVARLLWIGRAGLFAIALACVVGCTFHLVTIQVTPADHRRDAGATASTQPAAKKSFMEMLIDDLAD